MWRLKLLIVLLVLVAFRADAQGPSFVRVQGHTLTRDGKTYRFVGANYWYGGLLGLEPDPKRGLDRLRHELDFLKAHGIKNLRLMAGAEGTGMLNGVMRVGPSLQPDEGKFDLHVLEGLDRVLYEMDKRQMTAVIFLSNNWEWTGGFQQYLLWKGLEPTRYIRERPTWDEYRSTVAAFYICGPCQDAYRKQVETVIGRTNTFNGKRYIDDPTIMAWELANEPRPMRPAANEGYRNWISRSAALIRSLDPTHLITIGHEGSIGTEGVQLYQTVSADRNIDYLTIHIWPKNWGWFSGTDLDAQLPKVIGETDKYVEENVAVARRLDKPMVIEEFGLPRDGGSFDPASRTTARDKFYARVLSYVGQEYFVGANFWAFAGESKPIKGQVFWKQGDAYTADPPMEEQGLNSVFETDRSTWKTIGSVIPHVK